MDWTYWCSVRAARIWELRLGCSWYKSEDHLLEYNLLVQK